MSPARALALDGLLSIPVVSWFLRRTGNTLANAADAERLLRRDELVLVFPEGVKGTGKHYSDRYRLRRFGRGGFVEIALRTRAPARSGASAVDMDHPIPRAHSTRCRLC